MRASVWAGAAAAFAVALNANAAPPHPNVKLLDAVKACDKDARALMEQAVAIDSGTGDAEGLAAVGALFGVRFKALGAEVKSIAPTPSAVGDASLAAQAGAPTLDGFAMEGDGAHSVDDSADFSTLTPRAYLLALMLMDVGRDPEGR